MSLDSYLLSFLMGTHEGWKWCREPSLILWKACSPQATFDCGYKKSEIDYFMVTRDTVFWRKKKEDYSPDVGLEPTTLRLRVSCSTDWANRAACMICGLVPYTVVIILSDKNYCIILCNEAKYQCLQSICLITCIFLSALLGWQTCLQL